MGGGMRQAGYLAAACLFALKNQRERLKLDNNKAREIGSLLEKQSYVKSVRPVKTNIVIFDLAKNQKAEPILEKLKSKGILATAFGPETIRFVTHLDYTDEMHDKVLTTLENL